MPLTRRTALTALLGPALAASAPARGESWPRTVDHTAGEARLAAEPRRVVSTSPSVTGVLLAVGAPLVASAATTPSPLTDAKGFFVQWAPEADRRGVAVLYPNLAFDIEAVVGARPDLAVVSATGQDSVAPHRAELEALGIPTVVVDYSNRSWQELAAELGRATGREDGARAAVAAFDADLTEAARALDPRGARVSVVGYNIAGSYSVARPSSPVARLVEALGFSVAGAPADVRPSVSRPSDFAFFSRENLPAAITGDTVFLLRATERDAAAFLAEPVLANHPAVVGRRVYPLGLTSFRIDPYSGRQVVARIRAAFARP